MATTTSQDTPGGLAHKHERGRWSVLGLLALAQLMLVLDVTVVNVALPDIGADLQLNRAALPWVMTTYTLAFGGLMLLGGRVADLLGAPAGFCWRGWCCSRRPRPSAALPAVHCP
jgi:MFS family permease